MLKNKKYSTGKKKHRLNKLDKNILENLSYTAALELFILVSPLLVYPNHTLGNVLPISSVVMGGKIIEKHFILDRNLGGPDAEFSLNPTEFKEMVTQIRLTEKANGRYDYPVTEKMKAGKRFARSLYYSKELKAGEVITSNHIRSVRPGYGLHPKFIDQVIGKKLTVSVETGDRVNLNRII